MIGDAAHALLPTSSQGACQALEDAWHLANILKRNSNDLQKTFNEFTNLQYEKTTGIIITGRGFASSLFNRNESYCLVRNENSKNTDFSKVIAAMSRCWARHLSFNK